MDLEGGGGGFCFLEENFWGAGKGAMVPGRGKFWKYKQWRGIPEKKIL